MGGMELDTVHFLKPQIFYTVLFISASAENPALQLHRGRKALCSPVEIDPTARQEFMLPLTGVEYCRVTPPPRL